MSTDRAWAAGFFDGEGCFHCSKPYFKHGGYYVNLSCRVGQKFPDLLYRFRDIVGVGSVRQNSRGMWTYQIASFDGVVLVYKLLYPWLGEVKRNQGDTAIQAYKRHQRLRTQNETVASK